MAEDVREAILSRLETLLATISGVDDVSRNKNLDDDTSKNRIVILEGDELTNEDEDPGSSKPANAPRVVYMQPQILLAVSDKATDVGSELSALRGQVIQAITADATLSELTHKGRVGRYIGLESDLAFGRMMTAQMALKYRFAYVLRPDQFA